MNLDSSFISGIVGAVILLFSIVLFFWGRKESIDDNASLSERTDTHHDVKLFLDGDSSNFGPGSLKMGAGIGAAIGIALIILAVILTVTGEG